MTAAASDGEGEVFSAAKACLPPNFYPDLFARHSTEPESAELTEMRTVS
jgi:hypothetical protein